MAVFKLKHADGSSTTVAAKDEKAAKAKTNKTVTETKLIKK